MDVPTALDQALRYRRVTQQQLGARFHLSPQMVSALKRGDRYVPHDIAPRLARFLDYPPLDMALALRVNGGAGPDYFDGPGADQHCLCRSEDAVIEMAEAIAVMERARAALVAGGMSEADATRYEDEMADAIDRLQNALARHCLKTGRSHGAVWERQRAHNVARGYISEEARRNAQRQRAS